MKQILLAALVGGLLMFAAGAVMHMATPFGHMGWTPLPNEESVVAELKESNMQAGLYFFPGADLNKEMSGAEKDAYKAKRIAGPVGMLTYSPVGEEMPNPRQLLFEFASNVLAALLAALLVSKASSSLVLRVLLSVLIGAVGWLSISASYYIWYGFPQDFVVAEGIMQGIGWFVSGIGIALCLRESKGG